jgi:hypothetical protein
MTQEGAFAAVALKQIDFHAGSFQRSDAEDETRKAGAGAEIEPSASIGSEIEELEGIGDMPRPDVFQRFGPDEVFDPLPAPELLREKVETAKCFT